MDGAELTPTPTTPEMMSSAMHSHVARPTLGFPLGTALLLIIIFCLSGVFSCCYHWDKLRSLRRRSSRQQLPVTSSSSSSTNNAAAAHQHLQLHSSVPLSPSKLNFQPQDLKKEREQSLPVIMAGDRFPKFMALPCPCNFPPSSSLASSAANGGGGGMTTVIAVGVLLLPSPSPSFSSPSPPHSVN